MLFKVFEKSPRTLSVEDIIAIILRKRGLGDHEFQTFLNPKHPAEYSLYDLGIKKMDFQKARDRLKKAKANKESVVIYSDYDVDGITGNAIVWETLHRLGFSVMPYIGNRHAEGYGFSETGIKNMTEKLKPSLVIAVDHGLSAESHIRELKKKGVDVIVLDHHLAKDGLPKSALSILFSRKVSGAGIAYYFAKELDQALDEHHLVYAGIGTIADVVSLKGIARSLAYHALRSMPRVRQVGFRELLDSAGIGSRNRYGTYDIGFIIGPRLNAAGRLGNAMDALRLLCTRSRSQAKRLTALLEQVNSLRQTMVRKQLAMAERQIILQQKDPLLMVFSESFDEGVVGLLAARLSEKYRRPAFVGSIRNGSVKGSVRAADGINVTELLSESADLMSSYGGHEKAAGFLFETGKIDEVRKRLLQVAAKGIKLAPIEMDIDLETGLGNMTLKLAYALEGLEPFGEGNSQPLFMTRRIEIANSRKIGKLQNHHQFMFRDPQTGVLVRGVMFNSDKLAGRVDLNSPVTAVYRLVVDSFREEKPSLIIHHLENS